MNTVLLMVSGAFVLYAAALQLHLTVWGLLAQHSFQRYRPSSRVARVVRAASAAPPATLLLPVHNEELMAVGAATSALQIRHPGLEIVMVSDGSTDSTMDRLIEAFDLVPVDPVADEAMADDLDVHLSDIAAVWFSRRVHRLRVVERTVAAGSKAGAVNTGLLWCSSEWVAIADGDELFDRHVLSRVLAEAADTPGTVAVGVTLLPTNDGVRGEDGALVPRVPGSWLAGCQTIEYLRSFLLARPGMAAANALTIVSGGFGVWATADVIAVGGLRQGHMGEDMDLAIRVRRHRAERAQRHRIVQVPTALAFTEVPDDRRTLRNQRMRWHRGLTSVLHDNRDLLGRRRFGPFGTVGMPSALAFEWAAPIIEAIGYIVVVVALALGVVDVGTMAILLALALAAGWTGSFLAIWVEARHLGVYRRRSDTWRLALWAVVEPLGYRQLTVWWRVRSHFGADHTWGTMRRTGLRS